MESHDGGSQVDEMLREEAETFIWLKVKRGDIVTVRDIQLHLDLAQRLKDDDVDWGDEDVKEMSSNEIVDLVYELGFRLRLNHESISDSVVTS
jgi:hypothetical protein